MDAIPHLIASGRVYSTAAAPERADGSASFIPSFCKLFLKPLNLPCAVSWLLSGLSLFSIAFSSKTNFKEYSIKMDQEMAMEI